MFVEGHQRGVEGGVQMRRQQEAIVDVEAFLVGVAGGPWLYVARAEERAVGDAGDGAAAAPVVFEGSAEDVLTDALLGEALRFGARGHGLRLFAVRGQRRVGERADECRGAADRLVGMGAGGAENDQAGNVDA